MPPHSGAWAEDLVARYLSSRGAEILARNWRCREGELDIVARHTGILLFVEVRSRRNESFGSPLSTITARKRRRLAAAAARFLAELPEPEDCRFDAAGITGDPESYSLSYIEGAFDA